MAAFETSRRDFLKAAAAAGAALVVGLNSDGALAASGDGAALNPFVRVGADGQVTVILKHFEMGQGTSTGLTTLVAEELGVPVSEIEIAFAPSNPKLYNNLLMGPFQGTGGSNAIANAFLQYRTAGAAARAMLLQAAAAAWKVNPTALSIEGARLSEPAGRRRSASSLKRPRS